MSSRVLLFLTTTATLITLLPCVCAQVWTTATCLPQYNWMNNSRSQNPCLVTAYLQSVCTGGSFEVQALPVGTYYTGPNQQQSNPCQCSTVTFSVTSACGICQNRTVSSWSGWRINCTVIYDQRFDETIPVDTAVPAWAYLDVVTSDNFDPAAAQADASAPESTGSSLATATLYPSTTFYPSASGSKKSHTGAIAGGVVGGIVVLGLILGAIAFIIIRRRHRRQIAPSAANDSMHNNEHVGNPVPPPPPMNQTYKRSSDATQYSPNPLLRPKLYDPSDPTTFPSPYPPTVYTTQDDPQPGQPKTHSGQYNFVPEL